MTVNPSRLAIRANFDYDLLMALKKDRVVVIKSTNFREADKILVVLGKNYGKYSLIARGIRKLESKNRGNMQTLSISDITFYEGQNLGTLVESDLVYPADYPANTMKNIERFLRMIYKLIQEGDEPPDIFDAIESVAKSGFDTAVLNRFRVYFLSMTGFLPDYTRCVSCGSSEVDFLDKSSFEMYCSECADKAKTGTGMFTIEPLDKYKSNPTRFSVLIDGFIERIIVGE